MFSEPGAASPPPRRLRMLVDVQADVLAPALSLGRGGHAEHLGCPLEGEKSAPGLGGRGRRLITGPNGEEVLGNVEEEQIEADQTLSRPCGPTISGVQQSPLPISSAGAVLTTHVPRSRTVRKTPFPASTLRHVHARSSLASEGIPFRNGDVSKGSALEDEASQKASLRDAI